MWLYSYVTESDYETIFLSYKLITLGAKLRMTLPLITE